MRVKIESRTGELLWPELIRVVFWCGVDDLGLSVVSIREIIERELDPENLNSWERAPKKRYALVEFEIPEGVTFDVRALRDTDSQAPGVLVTLVGE